MSNVLCLITTPLPLVNGILTRHERYLYRGYLQIAALDMLNSANVKHTIVWDASEPTATRPLALQIGANAYYYSFDQVKNVTELFDGTGALAATYDYSPFGQVTSFQITQSGSQAITQFSNPLTFSSEIHDSTLGLQYYNYRHLNTLDGRWVNRDPILEQGSKIGISQNAYYKNRKYAEGSFDPDYVSCRNDAMMNIDLTGQYVIVLPGFCGVAEKLAEGLILIGMGGYAGDISVMTQKAGAALFDMMVQLDQKCPNPCCKFGWHGAHHDFPGLGKKCHLQINCWIEGVDNSGVVVRVPIEDSLCPPKIIGGEKVNKLFPTICARTQLPKL
jgi:RHS repeat-associated protein